MTRRECLVSLLGSAFLGGCRGFSSAGGSARRIALNASTVREFRLPLLEQVRLAAAAGYGGFEPWLCDLRQAKADGALAEAVAVAKGEGLAFVNGIAFGSWVNPDAAQREAGLSETARDMALLAEIGCPCIAASMFGVQAKGSPPLVAEEIAERYAALLALGKSFGVRPLLEYWGHSANLRTPEEALTVLRLVNHPDAALLPDVFHTWKGGGDFGVLANCRPTEMPVLHVNDFPVGAVRESTTDADRVWPGEGGADWKKVFATLAAAGTDPWLSLELFNKGYQRSTPEWTMRTGFEKVRDTSARHGEESGRRSVGGLRLGVQMWSVDELWNVHIPDAVGTPRPRLRRARLLKPAAAI